jgi:hypothetical protein
VLLIRFSRFIAVEVLLLLFDLFVCVLFSMMMLLLFSLFEQVDELDDEAEHDLDEAETLSPFSIEII